MKVAQFPIPPGRIADFDSNRSTVDTARQLLGKTLVTTIGNVQTGGIIVETEAYGPCDDPASHAHRGETARNRVMFGHPGFIYVYQIYGVHFCVNIVTEREGVGAAVLIRALQPSIGIDTMKQRRKVERPSELCRGPGRLCQALGIDRGMNGERLSDSTSIALYEGDALDPSRIEASKRIGITKAADLPWRFSLRGSEWVSGKRR